MNVAVFPVSEFCDLFCAGADQTEAGGVQVSANSYFSYTTDACNPNF